MLTRYIKLHTRLLYSVALTQGLLLSLLSFNFGNIGTSPGLQSSTPPLLKYLLSIASWRQGYALLVLLHFNAQVIGEHTQITHLENFCHLQFEGFNLAAVCACDHQIIHTDTYYRPLITFTSTVNSMF